MKRITRTEALEVIGSRNVYFRPHGRIYEYLVYRNGEGLYATWDECVHLLDGCYERGEFLILDKPGLGLLAAIKYLLDHPKDKLYSSGGILYQEGGGLRCIHRSMDVPIPIGVLWGHEPLVECSSVVPSEKYPVIGGF